MSEIDLGIGTGRDTVFWVVSRTDDSNAGFRIRTAPLAQALVERGLKVQTLPYAELNAQFGTVIDRAKAVILGKPGDTISYLCMQALTDRGVRVIVDLFDNYLSWSRLAFKRHLHWHWLRNLQGASMVMVSSTYLEAVVRSVYEGPVLRVSDPMPSLRFGAAEQASIDTKWALRRQLDVLWFGMADNPCYPVGLCDVCDWRHVLRALIDGLGASFDVRLTICTNRAADLESVLAMLREDGIDTRYVEWSPKGCEMLQAQAHVVLLPTNATGFGLSKTHNRCSDALARGSLVLCSPNGPYKHVGDAVQTDVRTLTAVLLKARDDAATVQALVQRSLQSLADATPTADEVERLYETLQTRVPQRRQDVAVQATPRILLVSATRGSTIKLSRTLNYLTAGFSDGPVRATFDFALALGDGANGAALGTLTLSPKAWSATLATINSNLLLDIAEGETQLFCRVADWSLALDKSAHTCAVLSGPSPQLQRDLSTARLLQPTSNYESERWFDVMVTLLTQTLRRLGFDRLELAADEGAGGWRAFATHASPALAQAELRLDALWQRHRDHEAEWAHEPAITQ